MNTRPIHILPAIVFAQFAGTSLWFAGNAVLPDLQAHWPQITNLIGWITSAVQLGFITGTLIFALFALADRFAASTLFLICSIAGAVCTMLMIFFDQPFSILVLRFLTGFFLAGIYPIGMKIAAGWYEKGLGKAIGLLVGALVLGTAFPSFIRGVGGELHWQITIVIVSVLAIAGGILIFIFVPDGPYIKKGTALDPGSFLKPFKSKEFRSAAFGYFGHMWELYAFWAFVPLFLTAYATMYSLSFNILLWTSIIIGAGSIGCIVGGYISERLGSARVAFFQLSSSAICCLISPLFFLLPPYLFLPFLIWWGIVVAGDSPQFSAINARTAPAGLTGTGLTAAVCIGFSITIFSIQLLEVMRGTFDMQFIFLLLLPGPILGLFALSSLLKTKI